MARHRSANTAGHITRGDILEDLGFTSQEIRETEIKMTIWRPLRAEIDCRTSTQAEVATLLQIHQPDASLLLRGKLTKFSITKLMQLAERLGLTVRLTVRQPGPTRHAHTPRPQSSKPATRHPKAAPAKPGQSRAA